MKLFLFDHPFYIHESIISIPSVHSVTKFVPLAYWREFKLVSPANCKLYTDSRLLGVLVGVRVKLSCSGRERLIGSSQMSRVCLRVSCIPSNLGASSTGRKRLVPEGTEHSASN